MTFTRSQHPYVGTVRAYLPVGSSPYDLEPIGPHTVARSGDKVTVVSAWTRDYLPDGGEPLLYIFDHVTKNYTHVTAADLPISA